MKICCEILVWAEFVANILGLVMYLPIELNLAFIRVVDGGFVAGAVLESIFSQTLISYLQYKVDI